MGGVTAFLLALALIFTGCTQTTSSNTDDDDTSGTSSGTSSGSSGSGSSGSGSSGASYSTDSEGLYTYVSTKYANQSGATWGCHDPKIFQDTDGTYYVYSTGWTTGVQLRYSTDLISWTYQSTVFAGSSSVSDTYGKMYWDDDFLKWVGYAKNDGTTYTASYSDESYTSSTTPNSWAPTVFKQNGKYYMFHGIITDSEVSSETDWNSPYYVNPAACITLAIADDPKGPFIPASTYDSTTYSQSSLVRYVWTNDSSTIQSSTDIGYSGCYNEGGGSWSSGFGCIDPEFIYDIATGSLVEYNVNNNTCYGVLYGSWKGGLVVIFVDAETFKPVCTVAGTSSFNSKTYAVGDEMDAPVDSISGNQGIKIAGGNGAAYEGAQLVYNSDTSRYYLFTSMGELTYEYRVGVGRSSEVTTFTPSAIPTEFLDASCRDMNSVVDTTGNDLYYHNVGSKIIGAQALGDDYGITSPGGLSVYRNSDGQILFANHARTNYINSGNFVLQIHQMFFNSEGWPVLNQNDFYSDYTDYTSDGLEGLTSISLSDIAGTYDTILTERSNTTATLTSASDGTSINYSAADAP